MLSGEGASTEFTPKHCLKNKVFMAQKTIFEEYITVMIALRFIIENLNSLGFVVLCCISGKRHNYIL